MKADNIRINSIDIFRALTMLLMIFVNDLWSLSNIPQWLGHTAAEEDGMGLADVVFPAFLFIVGLSIPYAIKAREAKGESTTEIFKHLVIRSFVLIVMGVFMVNLENINDTLTPISKHLWQLLMVLAFFLIWNIYKNGKAIGGISEWFPKVIGIGLLIYLAVIYKSGSAENSEWMKTHWWGILGLIGWGYLICASVYLLARDRMLWIAVACLLFLAMNVQEFIDGMDFRAVVSASNYASVMIGVLVTVIFSTFKTKENQKILALAGLAVLLFAFGFLTRPEWGISKIMATPSWTTICAGISTLAFLLLYWITDKLGISNWSKPLSPAGRSTLTCYLVPYYIYALLAMTEFELPSVLTTGYVGIIKSIVFSYLIIAFTGLLDKYLKVRLKI